MVLHNSKSKTSHLNLSLSHLSTVEFVETDQSGSGKEDNTNDQKSNRVREITRNT